MQMLLLLRREDDVDDVVKEQALMCLGNLMADGTLCIYLGSGSRNSNVITEKGIRTLLGLPDLVPGLAKCLSGDHQAQPMRVQALRCLRNVARSGSFPSCFSFDRLFFIRLRFCYVASNHVNILHYTEITSTVSEVLGELSFSASYTAIRAASTNEQKYALHFLHRISGSGGFFFLISVALLANGYSRSWADVVEEGCSNREVFGSEERVEMVFGERNDRGADEGGGVLEVLRCDGWVIRFTPQTL